MLVIMKIITQIRWFEIFLLVVAMQFSELAFGLATDAPQAKDDTVVINEDQSPFFICVIDNDLDGSAINATPGDEATLPLHIGLGLFNTFPDTTLVSATTEDTDAGCTGDSNNALKIVLVPNANGSDSTDYASEGQEGISDTASLCFTPGDDTQSCGHVTLTVNPVNDVPVFTKGANESILEDAGAQTVVGWATAISKGPTNESGQTLTFNIANDNNPLFLVQPSVDEATGTLTYTPAANINGLATVTISLSDDGGTANGGVDTSADQTFTITVTAVNDTPAITLAIADQTFNEEGNTGLLPFTVEEDDQGGLANEDSQSLTILSVSSSNTALIPNANVIVSFSDSGTSGSGTVKATPVANGNGSSTIDIVVSDNAGATVTETFIVNVTAVNDPPVMSTIPDQNIIEDGTTGALPFTADEDDQGGLANEDAQVLIVQSATSDNVALIPNNVANILVSFSDGGTSGSGTITITPKLNKEGVAIITVILSDQAGGTETVTDTFTVVVDAQNDVPTFTVGVDQADTEDDPAKTVVGFISDGAPDAFPHSPNEAGQTLSYALTNDNNALFASQPAVSSAGDLSYTLAAHVSGSAVVSVILSDNGGTLNGGVDTTAAQTFNVSVTAVADAPNLLVSNAISPDEDVAISLGLSSSLVDADGSETLGVVLTGLPAGALISDGVNSSSTASTDISTWALASITVIGNVHDDADFTLTVTSTATEGSNADSAVTVEAIAVTVNPVSDSPLFTVSGNSISTNEDTIVSLGITGISLVDTSETLTVFIAVPAGSTLTDGTNTDTVGGTVDVTGWTYTIIKLTPPLDDNSNFNAVMTATSTDGVATGADTQQIIAVTVNPVNDNPTVASAIADVAVNEDDSDEVISLTSVFADVDIIPNSDTLTMTVTGNTNPTMFNSVSLSDGSVDAIIDDTLTLDFALDQNGTADITITATDGSGLSVTDTFSITNVAVNDNPTVANAIADVSVSEDDPDSLISLTNVFADVDIATNSDTLTLSVTGNTNPAMFAGVTLSDVSVDSIFNDTLTLDFGDNKNGTADITVTATDGGSLTITDTFTVTVAGVNDAPTKIGADYSITQNEDTGSILLDFSFGTYFDDVDVANEGDVITYTIDVNDQPDTWVDTTVLDVPVAMYTTTSDTQTITINPDASGTIDIIVTATDAGGLAATPLNVTVTINALFDDDPTAVDDSYTMDEDDDPLTLQVLLNDDIGDGPTEVILAGVGFKDPEQDGIWETCTPDVANDLDCAGVTDQSLAQFHGASGGFVSRVDDQGATLSSFEVNRVRCINCGTSTADVTFDSGFTEAYILYTPRPDFNGVDTFDYTIKDADGGVSTATVTVTVNAVNDPPDIILGLNGSMDQGTSKTFTGRYLSDGSFGDLGLGARVFDRDATIFDGLGCDPAGDETCTDMQQLYFQITQAVAYDAGGVNIGSISAPFCCDGSVTFTPLASFVGNTVIQFDVCDTQTSPTSNNCTTGGEFSIQVNAVAGAAAGSVDDVVQFDYNFAESPLELPVPSIPNVLVLQDDSGSFAYDMMTDDISVDGLYQANGTTYTYIFPASGSGTGNAPTEEEEPDIGLWKVRTKDFNKIYYNPEIQYEPWAGLHPDGNIFPNSTPSAAIDDPYFQSSQSTDLTSPRTVTVVDVGSNPVTTCTTPGPKVKVPNPTPNPAEVFCDETITDNTDPLYCPEVCTTTGGNGTKNVDIYLPRYYVWADIDDPTNCPGNISVGDTVNGNLATSGDYIDGTSPFTFPLGTCTESRLVQIVGEDEDGASTASIGDEGLANYPDGFDDGSALFPKSVDRTDCSTNTDSCTVAEELANFANYYTYSRTREYVAKGSLGHVIGNAENLRVGFAGFKGNTNNAPIEELNESAFTGQKDTILQSIYNTAPSGGTPIRTALESSGEYFACITPNIMNESGTPGDGIGGCPILGAPEGNCQQNYTLLITDGVWDGTDPKFLNDPDADGIQSFNGSGTSNFDGGVFAGCATAGCNRTLADVAMFYYETDILPTLDDEVPVTVRDLALADVSSFGGGGEVMHQHMSTFVIAFGIENSLGTVPVDYTQAFDWGDPATTDGKINDLHHAAHNGRGAYLDAGNPKELREALEAAFEEFTTGVGTASAVSFNSQEIQQGSLVFRAFYNVKENTGDLIAQEFDTDGTIIATVWSAAEQMDLKAATDREIVSYDPINHVGIPFRRASLTTEQYNALVEFADGTEDQQVDDRVNYFRGDTSNERPAGTFRERPVELGRLGDIVNSSPVYVGPPDRLRRTNLPYPQGSDNYAFYEDTNVARDPRLYVSANDGMMHAFDPTTGEEVFGFIPNATQVGTFNRKLEELLDFSYTHKYFIDTSPAVNDVFSIAPGGTSKEWRSMVVGGYGTGGKGYFALDISDPSKLTEATADDTVFWEFTDDDDAYPTDSTGAALLAADAVSQRFDLQAVPEPVKDLGYTFSVPTIAMSNVLDANNEREWVVVFGNGFNSTAGIAKLFVLFTSRGVDGVWCHPDSVFNDNLNSGDGLRTGCAANETDFVKMDTGFGVATTGPRAGFPNGLGTPRGIDVDANGTIDYAYAGDTLGNFFRFDMCRSDLGGGECVVSTTAYTNWTVTKIFEAVYDPDCDAGTLGVETCDLTDGDEVPQPVLNRPLVVEHPTEEDGFVIIMGTGSYVTSDDRTNTDIQSLYGIWDRLGPVLIEKTDLVKQEYTNLNDANFGVVRTLTSNEVDYSVSGNLGWYNDLRAVAAGDSQAVDPPEFPGEKAIRNIQLRGGLTFVNSVVPRIATSCTSAAGGFALAFCPGTGGLNCLGDSGIFDLNNDGLFNDDDKSANQIVAATRFDDAVPTDSTFFGGNRVTQLSDQSLELRGTDTSGGSNTGRLSWKRMDSVQ
jgi:type IV pilus assembly protein PilY1